MTPAIHLSVARSAFARPEDDEPRDKNDPLWSDESELDDETLDLLADRAEVRLEEVLKEKFKLGDVSVVIGDIDHQTRVNYCTIDDEIIAAAHIPDMNAWIVRALSKAIDHVWGRDR